MADSGRAPEISVVVVTWNAKEYVIRCLESLKRQSMNEDVEIVVVDNLSTDGVQAYVRAAHKDATLVENSRNLGFARGNNIGIARARGRYVCLVNSDVELPESDTLRQLWHVAEHHRGYGVFGPRVVDADGRVQGSVLGFPRPAVALIDALGLHCLVELFRRIRRRRCSHSSLLRVDAVSGCFMLARTEALRAVGGFSEGFFFYGEDVDLCKRISDAGWGVAFVPNVEIVHFEGRSAAKAPLEFYAHLVDAKLNLWRTHRRHLVWLYKSFLALHFVLRCAAYAPVLPFCSTAQLKVRRSVNALYQVLGGPKRR